MKITHRDSIPFRIKLFAWLNIVVQTSFPLAAAFTPVIADADSNGSFLQKTEKTAIQTQVYTLSEGESVDSVAKKYNMPLDALRNLNQFRTFSHGFDKLKVGDELDVPMASLPEVHWEDALGARRDADAEELAQTQKVADYASQVGHFLANTPNSDATASTARGIATGAAGNEIQQWLSQFGTARVQLDVDENFSLKNSQLDLLVPWYEQKNSLTFTQSSLHRTDERTQMNLGMGYRWFADGWMLGGNTFLDYDLSRDHARLGLGIEYWRDFLKLGVNSYHRLTNWKNAPEIEDYEARPANGWDIRAQAWLPALPQLGGKLTYEQYYGNEVALFGKDNRQSNPHAITAGINYTPVPLLTFNAEQRQGKSGENDTRFGVEMNYRLGIPWSQQINPEAVPAMRTLAGSRYDLVERNNNIILEYRKKEVIHLKMEDLLVGYAGQQKSLGVSVNSKYGLDRIDWSASSLIAAGGQIVQNGADWTVVLPAYQSSAQSVNTYTVSAVAVDKKGNVSNQSETQVTVAQAAIDISTSSLTPPEITLPADGKTQQQLLLKVNDREGHPVDIAADEISIEKTSKIRGTSSAIISGFTRKTAGEYVATLTAGTMPESFTLTPSARNSHFAFSNVSLTADSTTALIDALEVVTDNAIADGKLQNKVKITAVDAEKNRVPQQTINLKADNDASVPQNIITDEQGQATVPVTATRAGEVTFTADIEGKGSKEVKLTFQPDQGSAQITKKDLTVTPESSVADGKTPKTVAVRVTDAQGNPVPDMPVTFSADNGASPAATNVKTDAGGLAKTLLTSTIAGSSQVTATVNNTATTHETTFTGNNATALVTSVTPAETTGVADGKTPVIFRALVLDQNGNHLSGVPVDWKSDKDSGLVVFEQSQTLTNDKGIAEASVTSSRAYTDVLLTAFTNASSKSASPFTFVADKKNAAISVLSSDKQMLTANGADMAALTVKVEDENGNPLSGMKITLSNSEGALIEPAQPVTGSDGFATAALKTTHAGEIAILAKLDNGKQKKLLLSAKADAHSSVVTVKAEKPSTTAGQTVPVTVTATVVDANKNPVSGTSVAWQTDHNQLNNAVTVTNAKGEAVVKLSGTQAVMTTVTAMLYNNTKASTQVSFGPGEPAQEHSELTVSPQSITADGQSGAQATLILRDQWDNPVPGQTTDWIADNKSGIKFDAKEQGKGVYHATVTGTVEGTWDLTANSGKARLHTQLGLLASQKTAQIDSVKVSGTDTAKADGVAMVTLQAQVKDGNGNTKLKGVAVGWDTTLGVFPSRLSYTDENGVAKITISSRQTGQAQVTAMLGGGKPVGADKKVTFTAGNINADKSSVSISPASIVAEKDSAIISVVVRDLEGNLLSGLKDKITLSFSTDLKITTSAFSETSSGVYEATVIGKKAGTTEAGANVNGVTVTRKASLAIRADNDSAIVKGSFSVTPTSASVGTMVTYSAILTDKNDNALGAGIPVTWSANEGSTLGSQVTHTDDAGSVQVTLTRLNAGIAKVDLILPSGTTSAPEVMFSAGDVDESRSELTLSPAVIVAGKETATLALTLRDKNNNLLSGQAVSGGSVKGTASVTVSDSEEKTPGHYTMTVSGKLSGTATISVKVDEKSLTQTKVLTVKGDTDNWKVVKVTPDKTRLTAGDSKGVVYSAEVTDTLGNKLSNVVVSWQLRGQSESYDATSRTNESGIATTRVISHTAGTLVMSANLDAANYLEAEAVTVIPEVADAARSSLQSDKTEIGSDNKDSALLTVTLRDRYDNTISGSAVTIEGGASLPGFNLGKLVDKGDGRYQAQATSNAKGQVTLNARAQGKTVGEPITIMVGATTPDLRFDNAQMKVTYTRDFKASQVLKGIPEGVKVVWSSINEDIASVDAVGKVTLHKAGNTRIIAQTIANEQYNPSSANYELNIERIEPKLSFGDGSHKVTYGDKFNLPTLSAGNGVSISDVDINWHSSDDNIVRIDNNGKITILKSGEVTITASIDMTDQTMASQASYPLVVDKKKLEIKFEQSEMKTTKNRLDSDKNAWSQATATLPDDAKVSWRSSAKDVLELNNDGKLVSYKTGRTRVSMVVLEDERYMAASSDYDLVIYGTPVINADLFGTEIAVEKSLASNSWKPYLKTDKLRVKLSYQLDEFTRPKKVKVNLGMGSGVLSSKEITMDSTGKENVEFPASINWLNKTLWVEVIPYDIFDKEGGKTKKELTTGVIEVTRILKTRTGVLSHKVWNTTGGKWEYTNTCSASGQQYREVYSQIKINIEPMAAEASLFTFDFSALTDYSGTDYGRTDSYKKSWSNRSLSGSSSSGKDKPKYNWSATNKDGERLAQYCYMDSVGSAKDDGTLTLKVDVRYGGKTQTLKTSMYWSGNDASASQGTTQLQ